MASARTDVHDCVTRRRLLAAAALLGLAASRDALALETLVVTAVSRSGGSGVAARLLAEIYRRAGLNLQVDGCQPRAPAWWP